MHDMETKRLIFPLEVKVGDEHSSMGAFEGYASVWNSVDRGGDTVESGAFSKTISEWKSKGQMPQLLWYHNMQDVIGEWLDMREDEKGLFVKGRLWIKDSERIESAVKAYNVIKSNSVRGLSIGYRVKEFELIEYDSGVIRKLKEIELMEVSIAPWAMEPSAMVTGVKSMIDDDGKLLSKREVERVLRDVGLSAREAKAFIAAGYDALNRDEEEKSKGVDRDDQLDLSDVLASLQELSTTLSR